MNAFGNKEYVNGGSSNDLQAAIDVRKMTAVTIPNGNYYINVRSKVASSVDIPGGSAADSTPFSCIPATVPRLSSSLLLGSLMGAMRSSM